MLCLLKFCNMTYSYDTFYILLYSAFIASIYVLQYSQLVQRIYGIIRSHTILTLQQCYFQLVNYFHNLTADIVSCILHRVYLYRCE